MPRQSRSTSRDAADAPVAPPAAETEAKPAASRRSRRPASTKPASASPATSSAETSAKASPRTAAKSRAPRSAKPAEEVEQLVVLEWRAREAEPAEARNRREPARAAGPEQGEAPARTGRRRGSRAKPVEDAPSSPEPTEEPEAPAAKFRRRAKAVADERPAPPAAPARPALAVPEDAPKVALLGGVPTLVYRGRAIPPIAFFGNSSDARRAETVQEEVRLAGENGVHLHVHLLEFEVNVDAVDGASTLAAYLLDQTLRSDPEGMVLYRVVFSPPRDWERRYPDAVSKDAGEPSICDDRFWSDAATCLDRLVRQLRLLPVADRILGLHLDRAEWFVPESRGYDTSPSALRKFRAWARERYSDHEVTLRASWFDGHARFDNIEIPPLERSRPGAEAFMRSSRKQRRYVDYHLFLSDSTVARIGELAYAVKAASESRFLVGVSYGYTFEWSHPASGHLALGKLLRTREVDFVAGPPSYRNREPGESAPFPCPVDSIALNGKLYLSEEDFKTSLGSELSEPDDFNPVLKTPQALESVHWRGAGAALAHGAGVCWMDLWGNGRLKTATIWRRGGEVAEAMARRLSAPMKDPDVAVFIDERSLAYLIDTQAFTVLVQNVRESVLRSGLSAGFYLLSDLAHRAKFPESRLHLFLNAWDIRPGLRTAIKNRLQRDGKVLFWLYGAGLFDGGRESLERAREVTGIALKPQPFHSPSGTTLLRRRHPLSDAFPLHAEIGATQLGAAKLEPSYFAIPEEAIVLGEYTQTGLPSFVVKEFNAGDPAAAWTSVFLGEPTVTPALIRALGQMAGAHVYDFQEDVVHASPPFLAVHCAAAGPRTIMLPPQWSAYDLHAPGVDLADGNSVRFNAIDGMTRNFLVGPKEELDALLAPKIDDLLSTPVLPEPDLDEHEDASFDVPVMKLGDWMEGGVTDVQAEEWLLRPSIADFEDAAPAEAEPDAGRSRRRRSRGGRREPAPPGEAPALADAAFEVNVTFRKRL